MPPRRVHTVQLTAPSDTLLRRGMMLLEDALHTATLPEVEGGRLWLVRSLNLGKISPRRSAATLALTVEQQFRHLRLMAVHGSDPAAATAQVVYFEDVTDAYSGFVLRLTQGAPLGEWFWPSVVPGWQPDWPPAIALKWALFRLVETPAQGMALVGLLHRLRQAGRLDAVLQVLQPEDGPALLQACGWGAVGDAPVRTIAAPDLDPAVSAPLIARPEAPGRLPIAPPFLVDWCVRWGTQDARSRWLAVLSLLMERPHWRLDPQVRFHAVAWMHQSVAASGRITPTSASLAPPATARGSEAETAAASSPARLERESAAFTPEFTIEHPPLDPPSPTSPAQPSLEPAIPHRAIQHPPIAPGRIESHPPTVDAAGTAIAGRDTLSNPELIRSDASGIFPQSLYRTAYAGFWGIIPLLNQLGLPQRGDRLSLDFPAHLLSHLATRFGIPTTDPIHPCLINPDPEALFPGIVPLTALTPEIIAWRAALRGWCRRYVGMPLGEVFSRSGSFTLTPTHLDIFFQLDQADIRIRRAGLDLDPGWVPWLGRVVLFHYVPGE